MDINELIVQGISYYSLSQKDEVRLHYGEIKVIGDKYHVIPRTQPSK